MIVDDVVYIGSSDAQRLDALDLGSGHELWSTVTGGWTWSAPAVSGDAVYVGTTGAAGYTVSHARRFWVVDRDSGEPIGPYAFEAVDGGVPLGRRRFAGGR